MLLSYTVTSLVLSSIHLVNSEVSPKPNDPLMFQKDVWDTVGIYLLVVIIILVLFGVILIIWYYWSKKRLDKSTVKPVNLETLKQGLNSKYLLAKYGSGMLSERTIQAESISPISNRTRNFSNVKESDLPKQQNREQQQPQITPQCYTPQETHPSQIPMPVLALPKVSTNAIRPENSRILSAVHSDHATAPFVHSGLAMAHPRPMARENKPKPNMRDKPSTHSLIHTDTLDRKTPTPEVISDQKEGLTVSNQQEVLNSESFLKQHRAFRDTSMTIYGLEYNDDLIKTHDEAEVPTIYVPRPRTSPKKSPSPPPPIPRKNASSESFTIEHGMLRNASMTVYGLKVYDDALGTHDESEIPTTPATKPATKPVSYTPPPPPKQVENNIFENDSDTSLKTYIPTGRIRSNPRRKSGKRSKMPNKLTLQAKESDLETSVSAQPQLSKNQNGTLGDQSTTVGVIKRRRISKKSKRDDTENVLKESMASATTYIVPR